MKILITGGKSAATLKILKAFSSYEVVLADYGDVPSFSSASYNFVSLGERNEDIISHNLLNACLNEQVDLVLPLHRFEISAIAKTKILFNEFNIAILLPEADDLAIYFNNQIPIKSDNWLVFKEGRILYTTLIDELNTVYGEAAKLDGVFYFKNDQPVANLTLFTI